MSKVAAPRGRRSDEQRFFDALVDGDLHTNRSIIEKLGWEKEKYERLRKQYIQDGKLVVGQGRGAKIGKASIPAKPLKVFISYSHKDEDLKNQLESHLRPLVRRRLIEIWSDRRIIAGEEWNKNIFKEIEAADIILLLVSIDFINSEFCYDREMERAMERNDSGHAKVIPIILRSCMWKETLFSKLQATPKDAKPVSSWLSYDDAFVNIAEAIEKSAEALREHKSKMPTAPKN